MDKKTAVKKVGQTVEWRRGNEWIPVVLVSEPDKGGNVAVRLGASHINTNISQLRK